MRLSGLRALLFVALATALAQAQAPALTPLPAGTNVLLGRVLEMGTDVPVGGAMVTLIGHFDATGKPAARSPILGIDAPPTLNVMTTAEGYFVFRNLPAGRFTAAARAHGYVISDFPATVVEIRDDRKPTEVQLRVWKHVTIGGRVVDEGGEPVTGIPVSALTRVASGDRMLLRRVATGLTDDRGVYRISQLAPGDYTAGVLSTTTTLPAGVAAALDPSAANRTAFSAMRLELIQSGFFRTYGCPECISNSHEGHLVGGFVLQRPGVPLPPAPDGRPLGFANTFYPGTSRAQEATVVALGSGKSRTDIDVAVRLRPTVTVAGLLTGPEGPMKHAVLTLASPGTDFNDFDAVGAATAITDGAGAFAFLAVAPGEYLLSSSVRRDFNEMTGAGRILWASQSVEVGDIAITGLTIVMQPGVPMSGSVEFRSASGVTNKPSQRQVISLRPIRAESWRTLPAVVQPDGAFRSPGDPPGRYLINASSPPGWVWHSTSIAGKPVPDEMIDLGSTELTGLVLTFRQTTNRVSGRVSDGNGAPDPDAAVIVFPADSKAWREGIFTTRRTRKVHATSTGAYEITTLAPGEYYFVAISVRLALNWQDPEFLARLISGATRATLGAEEEKTLPLRTITLSGR